MLIKVPGTGSIPGVGASCVDLVLFQLCLVSRAAALPRAVSSGRWKLIPRDQFLLGR